MRVEFLVLAPESESYCTSKKAFIDFLKADSLISVSGKKISDSGDSLPNSRTEKCWTMPAFGKRASVRHRGS